jgi:DNA-binding LytR/AlgR family response regulator
LQPPVLELPVLENSTPVATALLLHLKGDNLSENFQLAADDFLFASANDNYTHIFYLRDGLVQQVLFRVSVKSLSEQAAGAPSIFRCHKSFLVNLQQVAHISGNAQGYKLHLQQNEFSVPVSRSLNSQVKQQLQGLHPKK